MPISAPSDLAGLTLWVESAEYAGSEGANVATWTEAGAISIGHEDDLSEGSTGQGPQWHDNVTPANQPVMRFIHNGGLGEALHTTARVPYNDAGDPDRPNVLGENGYTAMLLARVVAGHADTDFKLLKGASASGLNIDIFYTGTAWQIYILGTDTDLETDEAGFDYTLGDWALIDAVYDRPNTTFTMRVNGCQTTISHNQTNFPYESPSNGFDIGDDSGPSDPSDVMEHCGCTVYNRALTSTELTDLRNYWATKYGIDLCCDDEDIVAVGPTLWVEADSVTGVASGDEMSYWPEAGPIAIDGADDLTAANFSPGFPVGPIWSEDGPCGFPVVQFDSATGPGIQTANDGRRQESLTGDEAPADTLAPADAFTVIAVGRVTEWDASGFNAFDLWAQFGNSLQIAREDETTDPVVRFTGGDSSGSGIYMERPYTTGEWVFAALRGQGGYAEGSVSPPAPDQPGTLKLQVNGTESSVPWSGIDSGGPVWIDWNAAAGDAFAEMLALLMFPRYLTDAEVTALRTEYFACRYPCLDFGGGEPTPAYIPVWSAILG